MHRVRVVPVNEVGTIPVPMKKLFQFIMADPSQDRRTGNLVSVEVKDRQHGAVDHLAPALLCGIELRRRSYVMKDIFAFRHEDFTLEGYDPHPAIAFKVAV